MPAKKRKSDLEDDVLPEGPLLAPNAGELDVLAVLWQEQRRENRALPLSEVYRQVCERRRSYGEPEPPLTTVSTHLRNLVKKELVEDVGPARPDTARPPVSPVRTRGGYRPQTRSSGSGYRARYEPGQVISTILADLAEAYPPEPEQRLDALLDFARVLRLPEATCERLVQFVHKETSALGKKPS